MKPQLQKIVSFLHRHKRLWITIVCVILGATSWLAWNSWKRQQAARPEADAAKVEADKAWSVLSIIDRGQGFGARLDAISVHLSQGATAHGRHFFTAAQADYLAALIELRDLERLGQDRRKALESKEAAEAARMEGLQSLSGVAVHPSWEKALGLEKSAAQAFEQASFEQAASQWNEASTTFKEAAASSMQGLKDAQAARTEWKRRLSLYSTTWLEKYAGSAWKEFSGNEATAEKNLEDGKFAEAAVSYQTLTRQFPSLTRLAKGQQDKDQLQTAAEAYASALQTIKSQGSNPQGDPEGWKSIQKLESDAEKDALDGHSTQAAWRYMAARQLLQKENRPSLLGEETPVSPTPANLAPPVSRSFKGPLAELAARGKQQFGSGDLEGAAIRFQSILDASPCHPMALANLGVVRYQQRQMDQAAELLRAALAADPFNSFAASLLGIVLNFQNEHAEAADILGLAILIQPKDPENHNQLGAAWLKLGKLREAECELIQAIRLKPDLGAAHYNLAVVFTSQSPPSLELARKHYKKARELGMEANKDVEAALATKP